MLKLGVELRILERVLLVAFRIGRLGHQALAGVGGHLDGAIELLRETFGERRVLFDGHFRDQLP